MSRSESGSRPTLVPGCGMQFHEPPQRFELNGVVERSVSCVTLSDGALQSIVPLHTLSASGAPSRMVTSGIGAPAGGAVEPSASAGQQRAEARVDVVHVLVDEARGLAGQHLVALEAVDPRPTPARAVELVDRHEERVLGRPDAELRVVAELRRVDQELVAAPGAGRVARLRDRDALVVAERARLRTATRATARRTGRRARPGRPGCASRRSACRRRGCCCSPGRRRRCRLGCRPRTRR